MRTQRKAVLIAMCFFVVVTVVLVGNVLRSPQVNADGQKGEVEDRTRPVVKERGEFNLTEFIGLVHREVNERRAKQGTENLTHNKTLSFLSQSQSVWMNSTGELSELDEEGRSPRERVEKAGHRCEKVSQNVLSASTTTLDEDEVAFGVVERWWLDRPTRSSILSEDHELHGIGVVHTEDEKIYVTQMLC